MARLPSTAGDPQVTDVNLKTDLEKVADHIVEIDTVAQALDDDIIQTCNSFEPEIRSVAINIGDVQLVAQVSGGVTTLATNIDGINTVAANLGAILNCSTNMAILQLLDLRMADLEAITTSLPNIDLVATHMDSVIAVENGIPYVVNCVEHMEDIIKVSDNMNNTLKYLGAYSQDPTERPDGTPLQDGDYYLNTILNALVYYNLGSNSWFEVDPQEVLSARDEAVTAAEEAVLSADRSEAAAVGLELAETNAAQSASEALASENAAGLSEGKAKTSETNAKTSETNAEASAQRAEEAFDSFDDVYLGAFVTAPQTDNDGDPLEVGMTYWSTPEETLFYFTGSVWESPDAAAQDSANKAATSASEASASESAALVSANNASNSETASSASESAAGVSATQASTSASNAASSASGANQSKLDAQSAAVQAANSEARASSSESNAASSAVSALDSKEKARVSEVNALASESKASTSETNAATSAANALAEADRAETLVELGVNSFATPAQDFFALAEKRIRDDNGSGYAEWGKHFSSGDFVVPVNQGIWTRDLDDRNASKGLHFGRRSQDSSGTSRTVNPIVTINGTHHAISQGLEGTSASTGAGYDYDSYYVSFPPAPDGTKTYDSAAGDVVQHVDSATAFAAETATNKVITSRQDYCFLESWHEKISDSGKVFPLGNVQYGASSWEGVSLSKGYAQGYSAFGEWDSDTHGYCADWNSLTDEQKLLFIQDPENNIYVEDGELIQVRYRVRVVEGLGDDWEGVVLNSAGAIGYKNQAGLWLAVVGKEITASDYTESSSNFFVGGESAFNSKNNIIGQFVHSTNSSGDGNEAVAYKGLCFAIPIALVQRRNQGAYHPVYNPNGCKKWRNSTATANTDWYGDVIVTSVFQCFDISGGANKPSSLTGDISSSISGRPDNKFYDAIYASDVNDLRMSSKRLPLAEIREDYKRKAIAGEVRGFEGVPFTHWVDDTLAGTGGDTNANKKWNIISSGFAVFCDNNSIGVELGDRIRVIDIERDMNVVGEVTSKVEDKYLGLGNAFKSEGSFYPTNANEPTETNPNRVVIIKESLQQHSQANPTWTDIIGDPANILATFPDGVEGQWIPQLPVVGANTFSLNRKALNFYKMYRTRDDGASWVEIGNTLDSTLNTVNISVGFASEVYLNHVETQAHFTEDDDNNPSLLQFDSVYQSIFVTDSILSSSLIGKVLKDSRAGAQAETVVVNQGADGVVSINNSNTRPTYNPTPLRVPPLNDTARIDFITGIVSSDGVANIALHYKEVKYADGWGNNGSFSGVDGQSTLTDDNGNTVKHGTASFKTQHFIVEE